MVHTVCSTPHIQDLQRDTITGDAICFLRADLEEFDVPRLPPWLDPPPPEDTSPPPPSEEAAEYQRQMRHWRPKVLELPYKSFAGSNSHALVKGLTTAAAKEEGG